MDNNLNNNDEVMNVVENNFQPQVEQKKKSGKGKVIAFVIAAVIVLVGVLVLLKQTLFASNAQKFANLLLNEQKILSVLEEKKLGQVNTTIRMDVDEMMEKLEGESVGIGKVQVENKLLMQNEDMTNITQVSIPSFLKEKIELQTVKTGNVIGFHVPKVTPSFIAVDLDDMDGLKENLDSLGMNLSDGQFDMLNENKVKEYENFGKKYLNIILEEADPFITVTPNVELDIEDNQVKAKEYALELNEESYSKIVIAILKKLVSSRDDMKYVMNIIGYDESVSEFKRDLESLIQEGEKFIEEKDFDDDSTIVLKVYEKDGKNIATTMEMESYKIGFYVFDNKNHASVIFRMDYGREYVMIIATLENEKNQQHGELTLRTKVDGEKIHLKVLEYEQEEFDKLQDKMIKIDKDDCLLLNEATEREMDRWGEKASDNLQKMFGGAMRAPSSRSSYPYNW